MRITLTALCGLRISRNRTITISLLIWIGYCPYNPSTLSVEHGIESSRVRNSLVPSVFLKQENALTDSRYCVRRQRWYSSCAPRLRTPDSTGDPLVHYTTAELTQSCSTDVLQLAVCGAVRNPRNPKSRLDCK